MLKIVKESSGLFGELSNSMSKVLEKAELAFRNDELSAEEFEELLQGAIGQIREFADDRGIFLESKGLNEDIVSALKILFDNSTLDHVKKVMQAKQIAKSLGIDEKELIKESKKINEDLAINGYVVVRPQYLASDSEHRYNEVTFNRADAALFSEYEDAVDAMQMVNMRSNIVTDRTKFEIKKFKDMLEGLKSEKLLKETWATIKKSILNKISYDELEELIDSFNDYYAKKAEKNGWIISEEDILQIDEDGSGDSVIRSAPYDVVEDFCKYAKRKTNGRINFSDYYSL